MRNGAWPHFQVAFGVEGGHAARAGRRDGLAVGMVLHVAAGEDARHAGLRAVVRQDVAVRVELDLAREIAQYAVIRPLTVRLGKDPGARPAGKIKTGAQIGGTAGVVILSALSAAGVIAHATLRAVSIAILAGLVTLSAVSLYWYIRPLVGARSSAP